jgi:dipeptidyl aminopeptidase/acylaminoacyl peptidase
VLVHFHGGPEGQSKPGFSPLWQLFVDAGFIVVDPNVRGSTGYGKAWLDADNGPKRLQVLGDIEDAALYARKAWARNGVAPKVGVFGGSYGGYATLMAMTRFAGAYDAGVSVVGIANLLSFLENTAPYRRQLRVTEYGDPATDREALKQLSATTWVHQLKAPLMIIQGANDPRVPVGEALQMHEAAKARGVPLELMIFADEGHGASSRGNQALEYGHMLRFFQQHLQGVTPAPAASAPPAAPAASPSPAPAG